MLLLISSLKLVCEVALLALIGQGVLYLLAGARRESNVVYGLLRSATRPFMRVVGRWLPAQRAARWTPPLTFVLLGLAWLAATAAKIHHCLGTGMAGCR